MVATMVGAPVAGATLDQSVTATVWNVAYPPTPEATDYLVLRLSLSVATAITTPTGWTPAGTNTGTGSTSPRLAVFIKQADGTETGTLAVTVPSSVGNAKMYKISNVDLVNPLDVAARTISLAATTAYNITGPTTVTDGCLIMGFAASNQSGSGTFTPPTVGGTWTETYDINTNMNSSDAWIPQRAAGAVGTINFLHSSSVRGAVVALAFRPAAFSGAVTRGPRDGQATSGASTATVTLQSAPVVGSLMVATIWHNVAPGVTSIPGWTLDQEIACGGVSSNGSVAILHKIADASDTATVTSTTTGATVNRLQVVEYGGVDPTTPVDSSSSASAAAITTSQAAAASGQLVTTSAKDALVAAWGWGGGTSAWSVNSSFTIRKTDARLVTADRLVAATGTYNPTLSWTTSNRAAGAIVAFKAASVGGVTPFIGAGVHL